MDRRDFLMRSAKVAGAAILAGSLGWLAGCAGNAATEQQTQVPQQTYTQGQSSQPPLQQQQSQQPQQSESTAAVDCPFYRDGTCGKTGRPCTNCIADKAR